MKAINKSLTLSSFPDWMISFLLPIYCTGLGFSPAQTTLTSRDSLAPFRRPATC